MQYSTQFSSVWVWEIFDFTSPGNSERLQVSIMTYICHAKKIIAIITTVPGQLAGWASAKVALLPLEATNAAVALNTKALEACAFHRFLMP